MRNCFILVILFLALTPFKLFAVNAPAPAPPAAPAAAPRAQSSDTTTQQLIIAYNYAYSLYEAKKFSQAKDLFRKIVAASTEPIVNGNSLYYYSQCAFRTGDYDGCIKGLDLLTKRWPNSPAIQKGYVTRFASFLIDQVSALQTNWDYYRYKDTTAEGNPNTEWKESVPVGYKIKRINFKLGFGLYKLLQEIQPKSTETVTAKQKLDGMLNQPIKILWVDEKAPPNNFGHPADFYSTLSDIEKAEFSKAICDRMFYDWKTDKLCEFFDVYDNVENLRSKFVARTKEFKESAQTDQTTSSVVPFTSPGSPANNNMPKPPMVTSVTKVAQSYKDPTAVLTLSNLFLVAGYNPYTDTFTNLLESLPTLPGM
jgi:tetratricopeptide (TPR) repeat protein